MQTIALLALLGVFGAFYTRMRVLNGRNPFGELGVIFMAWCMCYSLVPVIALTFSEGSATEMMDSRIVNYGYDTDALATIAFYNLGFGSAFMAGYAFCCRTPLARFDHPSRFEPTARQIHVVVIAALILWIPSSLLNFALSRPGEGHEGQYIQYNHLPLILQQVLPILNAITQISVVALVALLALRQGGKGRWPIAIVLSCYATSAILVGNRAGLMSLLVALATALFIVGFRVKLRTVLLAGIGIGFLMFWIGTKRQQLEFGDVVAQNEFLCVFGTQLHIASLSLSGDQLDFPLAARFGDLLALSPQQIVPFTKSDGGTWYMQTFFPLQLESGVGFSFSVIAECFVGFGFTEACIRGLALGLFFAWLRNLFARHNSSPFCYLSYIYICVTCYFAYRATTFAHVRLILFNLVPFLALCWVLDRNAFRALAISHFCKTTPDPASGNVMTMIRNED